MTPADSDQAPARSDAPDDRTVCSACRGTGEVISNLGGSPRTVTCPWCEGTGRFLPDHDAQAARRGEGSDDAGREEEDAAGGRGPAGDSPAA